MILSKTFQVAAFLEKLPLDWKNFINYLKHKRNKMNVEELIVRFRIKRKKSSEKEVIQSWYG